MKITWRDQKRRLHGHDSNALDWIDFDGEHNGLDIGCVTASGVEMFMRDIRVDGELVADRLYLPPGGMFLWQKGNLRNINPQPVPEWAPHKLASSPATTRCGPVDLAWASDLNGNAPSGAGINFYRTDWRMCKEGIARLVDEALGVARRTPVAYGAFPEVDRFALEPFWDVPIGFDYNMGDARRWDDEAPEYLTRRAFDGQHWWRAASATIALKDLHPWFDWFARQLLVKAKLSWARRDIGGRPKNKRLWTLEQILDPQTSELERKEFCNREYAHMLRMADILEPHGDFIRDLEDLLLSAGMPWHGGPHGCPESRVEQGGPWEDGVLISHVFELLLVQDAAQHRPRLRGICRDMYDFLGPDPEWTVDMDGVQFSPPTGAGPKGMALYRGDFHLAGYEGAEEMLLVSKGRGVEDSPIDYCPRRFWEGAI